MNPDSPRQAALQRLKNRPRRAENTETNNSGLDAPFAISSPHSYSPSSSITGRRGRQSLPTSQLTFSLIPDSSAPALPGPGNLTGTKAYKDRALSVEARVQSISNLLSSTDFTRAIGSMPLGAGGDDALSSALAGLDNLHLDDYSPSPSASVGSSSGGGGGGGALRNATEVRSMVRIVQDLEGVVAGMKESAERERRAGREYQLNREMGHLQDMITGLVECLGVIGQRVSPEEGERLTSRVRGRAGGATTDQMRGEVCSAARRPLTETPDSRRRAAVEKARNEAMDREQERGSGGLGGWGGTALEAPRRGEAVGRGRGGGNGRGNGDRGGSGNRGGNGGARRRGEKPAWNF